jgi:hypothetical protein
MAGIAVEALFMIFAFQLTIGRRYRLLFYGQIAATTLEKQSVRSTGIYTKAELTLGKYIFFQHLSHNTPPPSTETHRSLAITFRHFKHALAFRALSFLTPVPSKALSLSNLGLVKALIGNFTGEVGLEL